MSLFDQSGQRVGNDSQAIQAGRDINLGNSTTEVIAICQLAVQAQMSSLREEALNIANQRANEFGNEVGQKIAEMIDEKVQDKLKDPDIQYSINQAVIQVARKGPGTKAELLKELIVSKINDNLEEEDLLIDHAIEITPRLTTSEIKILSLIYYFQYISKFLNGIEIDTILNEKSDHQTHKYLTVEFCQTAYKNFYSDYSEDFSKFLGGLETLSPVNSSMLNIKGCILDGKTYIKDYFEILKIKTGVDLQEDEEKFLENFPVLHRIISAFGVESLKLFNSYVLSPLGFLIARNYLKAHNYIDN